MCQPITIKGKIISESGEPIPSATITLKHTNQSTTSDNNGLFTIHHSLLTDTLIISAIGYETTEEPNNERGQLTIILKRKITALDEAVVIAYGTTTRRLNTGSIGKLSAIEIQHQPVANPLLALSGRIPGLLITQSNGLPGAAVKVQIRGQNSIAQGSDPLFIIDGVPFAPNNDVVNQFSSALGTPGSASKPGGISPFTNMNPADIESIEILKDADATAIYGSRAANGVILITTKKAKPGKTKVELNSYAGISQATRLPAMLNTQQYLQLRHEAFANDGITPTTTNAPDLLVWDTTRYTDLKKLMMGNKAHSYDAQVSVTGGTSFTKILLAAGYHRETTIFPGHMFGKNTSVRVQADHTSANRKFNSMLSAFYAAGETNITSLDPMAALALPPNIPELYTTDGKLKWQEGGVYFENPLAYLYQYYEANTENLLGNLLLQYQLTNELSLKTSLGYNVYSTREEKRYPLMAQNPAYNPAGYADFGNSRNSSWIAEPQVNYKGTIKKGKIDVLAGISLQEVINETAKINASGYVSDALLHSTAGAGSISAGNNYNQYKYSAVFGRVNYSLYDRYIINLSGRRDGSSRFGPGKQFANFGAVGIAWIFSETKWIRQHFKILNYGKLRASYGSAGNDQIGNYQYLSTWSNTVIYQGTAGLRPTRLYNPAYQWELNRKLEFGLETGWFENRLLLTAGYFQNRGSNQLVNYLLPSQTGFSSVIENLAAVVQNSGTELTLVSKNINGSKLQWTTNLNLAIQRNKLISFPGLASSSYASVYIIGQPLHLIYSLHYLGVDAATGVYKYEDVNGDGLYSLNDFKVSGNTDPVLYGGMNNSISWKQFSIDVFFEFRQQKGVNYLGSLTYPGSIVNQPVQALQRWRQPGDAASLQRLSVALSGNAAVTAQNLLKASDAIYSDASYIRLKNIALSYQLPAGLLQKMKLSTVRIYGLGQNLLTLTKYKQSDPETQRIGNMPPLQTFTAGIQLIF